MGLRCLGKPEGAREGVTQPDDTIGSHQALGGGSVKGAVTVWVRPGRAGVGRAGQGSRVWPLRWIQCGHPAGLLGNHHSLHFYSRCSLVKRSCFSTIDVPSNPSLAHLRY